MRFLNLKNWEDLLNIEHFFMTSLPVKMTSYQKKAWSINRFWIELSSPKIFLMILLSQPTQQGLTDPLLSNFQVRKNRDIDPKSMNKPLFLTKSSMENSMSISVFRYFDVWYSCELKISFTNEVKLFESKKYKVIGSLKSLKERHLKNPNINEIL